MSNIILRPVITRLSKFMKKEDKKVLKQLKPLFLKMAIILGITLSILTLIGSNETIRKWLAGFFIGLITLLGIIGITDSDLNSEVIPESEIDLVKVVRVLDGDTIEIDNGNIVRLLGIDSPEQGECYYSEAKEELTELVLEEEIRMEKDIFGADIFGRLLRYVFLPEGDFSNDVFVNDYLLTNGLADTLFMSNSQKYHDILIHSRNEAVTSERGMWGACEQELEEKTATFETNNPPPNPDCIIKGNISEHGYGKTYFFPGCPNYKRVKVDFEKGDRYFCTNEEAEVAGFKMAEGCKY